MSPRLTRIELATAPARWLLSVDWNRVEKMASENSKNTPHHSRPVVQSSDFKHALCHFVRACVRVCVMHYFDSTKYLATL